MSSRLDYDQNRPRQARRKRVTSRAVMIALSVIAVVLAVGGVLAPQISYAREASRFDVISQEVDEAAREVESLQSLEEAERLLLTLRSDEARPLRKQLKELSQSSSKVLSSTFKKELAEHANALEGVISGADRVSAVADSAKKASAARAAEPGDPQTWFDVSSSQLIVYADISVEELERVDDGGTVTLGRVQNAKGLLATYQGQIAELHSQVDAAAERTDELETLLADVTAGVLAESQRVIAAERTVDDEGFSPEALGIVVDLEEWENKKTELDAATTELESAIKAETFAVNEDGDVIGVQKDSELPDGAIRIPGGDMIRLNYVLPKLQAYVAAADAEGDASKKIRDAIAQAEAAAAELAEQQAAEQNQPEWEEPGYTPPPVTPGDGGNAGSSGSDGGSGTDSGTGADGSGNPGDAGGGGTAEGGSGGAEGAGGAGEGGDGSAAAE